MANIFVIYMENVKRFDRNIKLHLATHFISNLGYGAFRAVFNLYILSMGMTPDFLGVILSLTPFASALASIPIGFLGEKIGFKRSFILINLVIGAMYLVQVVTPNRAMIMAGAFTAGLVACGNFIVQLPFVSHYAKENKNQAFTMESLTFIVGNAIGALIGGALHGWMGNLFSSEVLLYRAILITFSFVILAGSIPLFFMDEDKPASYKEISLSPYLHGIDANTARFATVELFLGSGMAFVAMFLNVLFVFYFNSTVEDFGVMSALMVIPTVFFLFTGPFIAEKLTGFRVVLISRVVSAVLTLSVVLTQNVVIGGTAYVLFRAIFGLAQSLWFAYAISVATKRSRMATSAWLEITFQLGLGLAALIGGKLIARESYVMLGILSSASMVISFMLTYFFFRHQKAQPQEG
jgi:predicted MFS family arabinose efflux permease